MDQKMADLPEERVTDAPPFTYCGVDLFGPFYIKFSRKLHKRYRVIFTCLSSRAIHLESSSSLETDSFIQALRRMIARRGNVRILRSDQGTNFIGANKELQMEFDKMDHDKISEFMQINGGDWLVWKFNPPKASHMGGSWERQIRSVRSILSSLMLHHGESLDDESFRTFICEAEAIVNSRPLTYELLDDPLSPNPISPNNILTMKSEVILPAPGVFTDASLYSRKRWKRVQYLLNQFWNRWRIEYLACLQERQKWFVPKRNFSVNDVVLIKDVETKCNNWPLAIVTDAKVDNDGLVRKVKVKTKDGEFERPIHKLILLVEK